MLEIDKRSEALSKYSALKTCLVGAAVFLAAITVFYLSPNVQVYDSNYSMLLSDVMLRGRTVDLSRVSLRFGGFDPGISEKAILTTSFWPRADACTTCRGEVLF